MNVLKKWFGKKEVVLEPVDLSLLKTDLHSHLFSGIDDGSKSMEESVSLVEKMISLGYKKLIVTPHIMCDFYKNDAEIIKNSREELMKELDSKGIKIDIEIAAEYYIDFEFENSLLNTDLMTFGDDNYILIEFSYLNCPVNSRTVIFDLQSKGYKVVIAHPERYIFWFEDFDKLVELKNSGVYFQINLVSLFGYYSKKSQEVARRLLDNDMVSFVGSDTHNMRHLNAIEQNLRDPYMHKVIESPYIMNKSL